MHNVVDNATHLTVGTRAAETPALEVVIVAFRSVDILKRCIGSLRSELAANTLIHVVDNASDDGTAEAIAELFPEVCIHRNAQNQGFGRANNVVLRSVQAPYVLVLNPDTEMRPGVVEVLIDDLNSHSAVGMVGCRLEQIDGAFDPAAKRRFPTVGDAVRYLFFGHRARGRYGAPEVGEREVGLVDAINGAFMLVRRTAMEEVGYFDEKYWMYGEDLDWCRRFIASGWDVLYDGRVTVLHLKGATSGRVRPPKLNYHFHKSMWLFYRDYEAHNLRIAAPIVFLGIVARCLATTFINTPRLLRQRQR